jgi:preprotein translocase subunit SecD
MKILITLIAICLTVAATKAVDIEATPIIQMRLVAQGQSATSEPMSYESKRNDKTTTLTVFVEKAVLIDQTAFKSASVAKDPLGRPLIDITLTAKGSEQFATVTQQNLHKALAIVIDGHLTSMPTIQSPITSGKVQISGSFTEDEANDLVNRINAAAKK